MALSVARSLTPHDKDSLHSMDAGRNLGGQRGTVSINREDGRHPWIAFWEPCDRSAGGTELRRSEVIHMNPGLQYF